MTPVRKENFNSDEAQKYSSVEIACTKVFELFDKL